MQLKKAAARAAALTAALSLSAAAQSPKSKVRWDVGGEVGAYVDSDHVTVITPAASARARAPADGWTASGTALVDIVSAASVDIVSTASPRWTEVRTAGVLQAEYAPREWGGRAHVGGSVEPDTTTLTTGGGLFADLEQRTARTGLDYTFSRERAGRRDTPLSVYSLDLNRHTLTGSLDLVLGPATRFGVVADVMLESGRQEKPYRWLPLFDPDTPVPVGASIVEVHRLRLPAAVTERLPDARQRYALSGRLAHRFRDSTLVLWDRLYADSWAQYAATLDARWVLSPSRRFEAWPRVRLHAQTGVDFWRRAYRAQVTSGSVIAPTLRTGDRELSPLWTASLGPGVRWLIGKNDPRSMAFALELEGSYTDFRDALYIDHRTAVFGIASFQMRLD